MALRKEVVSSLALLLFGVVFLIYDMSYPLDQRANPGPGVFPLIVGTALVILAGWQLFQALRKTALQGTGNSDGSPFPTLLEYFVYYRWKLLASGDVRTCLRPESLVSVDIRAESDRKREALNCFTSQTTLYHPWQTRPVLSHERVEEVSKGPEIFLGAGPTATDAEIFTVSPLWIRTIHAIEPVLKKKKDQIAFLLRSQTK